MVMDPPPVPTNKRFSMTLRGFFRQIERSLIRPVAKSFRSPYDRTLERKLAELENRWRQRLDPIEARLIRLEAGWNQHIPSLLNAVSSIAAFDFELVSLRREVEASAVAATERAAELRDDLMAAATKQRNELSELMERLNGEFRKLRDDVGSTKN